VKNLYYSGGLMEGTETILFFVLVCLWPAGFAASAAVFAVLTAVTTAGRIRAARRIFAEPEAAGQAAAPGSAA
jgi:hypothetical protein